MFSIADIVSTVLICAGFILTELITERRRAKKIQIIIDRLKVMEARLEEARKTL
ncbi:hypothetical protein PX699_13245 [Sphingobium sp. H39-3-25]|nr:hypothetical protein [Sphingobium arseniciresistens]